MSDQSQKSDQPSVWRTLLNNNIVGVIVGGLLVIVSQYYAAQFQFSTQARLQKVQSQRQVFARLVGRKFATAQLFTLGSVIFVRLAKSIYCKEMITDCTKTLSYDFNRLGEK